jgi:hypothetical protein
MRCPAIQACAHARIVIDDQDRRLREPRVKFGIAQLVFIFPCRVPRTEFSSGFPAFFYLIRASLARTGSIDHHRAGLLRSITKAEVAQDRDFITSGIIKKLADGATRKRDRFESKIYRYKIEMIDDEFRSSAKPSREEHAINPSATVAKRIRHRGEHEGNR